MRTYDEILSGMQERYKALTGFDADNASDIGIRLKVLAQQVYGVAQDIQALESQVFVQTSTGSYLEMHAETRGISRKNALPAQGTLRFWREAPAQSDILIARGILCATRPEPQVQFATTQPAVLPAGETAVEVPAQAVDPGEQGNVASGSVCLMVTPAPGISGVSNPASFSGGVDAENDAALRRRLLSSFANISNGTNAAYYYDLAMQHEGVASARVLPRQRGRGTVDVMIACHNPVREGEIVEEISRAMLESKEINVDVLVQSAVRDVAEVRAEVSILDGYAGETVMEDCTRKVADYVEALAVGESLLLAQLGKVLLGVDGVYNYRILSPGADAVPLGSHIVQAGEIRVTRMAVG